MTNYRLASRAPDGQVVSIYWSAVVGLSVDLAAEIVVLDGHDGFHGQFSGPAVAPIAVAAVATCHGRQRLLGHPCLEMLKLSGTAVDDRSLARSYERSPIRMRG